MNSRRSHKEIILFDEFGKRSLRYNIDDNNFTNGYGRVVYNLWDFFYPAQIVNFKKKKDNVRMMMMSKQGRLVEVYYE